MSQRRGARGGAWLRARGPGGLTRRRGAPRPETGAFYYANATDPAKAHIWLVYLEGGQWCAPARSGAGPRLGALPRPRATPQNPACSPLPVVRRCYDPLSCSERRKDLPYLTSSKFPNGDPRWPVVVHMTGIFSFDPERNPLAGANLVQIGYCSSDAWVGNIGAQQATTLKQTKNVAGTDGWAFQGQRIIEATLATLSTHFAFGAMPKTRLLFGGCSAGARGAMFNLDYVQDMVPQGVQVHGFLDSPLWCVLVGGWLIERSE